jgi:hypothetical protein
MSAESQKNGSLYIPSIERENNPNGYAGETASVA